MPEPKRPAKPTPINAGHHERTWAAGLALVAVGLITLVATAFAASSALTLSSTSDATLGEHVVVSPQGRTLYALSPETATHLLCKTHECFAVWPPLTVSSRKAEVKLTADVHGHLGLLRRGAHTWQVTLRGMPLYRFTGDRSSDEANGQNRKSLGGTWHAVTAASGETVKPATPTQAPSEPTTPSYPSTPTTPTTTTTTTTPPYTYPPY